MEKTRQLAALIVLACAVATNVVQASERARCDRWGGEAALAECSRILDTGTTDGKPLSARQRAILAEDAGFIASMAGRTEEALDWLGRAIEADPTFVQALHSRGYELDQLGRLDEAAADYTAAIEALPDPDYSLDPNYLYMNRSGILERLGRCTEAEADARLALETLAATRFYEGMVWTLHDCAKKRGDEATRKAFNRRITHDRSKNGRAFATLGKIALDRGDFSQAAADYAKAGQYGVAEEPVVHNHAMALFKLERCEQAIPLLDRAIGMNAKRHSNWLMRGVCHALVNEDAKARADMTEVLALMPDEPMAKRYIETGKLLP